MEEEEEEDEEDEEDDDEEEEEEEYYEAEDDDWDKTIEKASRDYDAMKMELDGILKANNKRKAEDQYSNNDDNQAMPRKRLESGKQNTMKTAERQNKSNPLTTPLPETTHGDEF